MAKLVWAFDILPGEGKIDQSVATGCIGGFLICPKEFPLKLVPRSAGHASTIEAELEAEKPFLAKFKN